MTSGDAEKIEEDEDKENDESLVINANVAKSSGGNVQPLGSFAKAENPRRKEGEVEMYQEEPSPPPVWDEICDQFDPDEETANFGTRHAFEAAGNLFDVFTLATVHPK